MKTITFFFCVCWSIRSEPGAHENHVAITTFQVMMIELNWPPAKWISSFIVRCLRWINWNGRAVAEAEAERLRSESDINKYATYKQYFFYQFNIACGNVLCSAVGFSQVTPQHMVNDVGVGRGGNIPEFITHWWKFIFALFGSIKLNPVSDTTI